MQILFSIQLKQFQLQLIILCKSKLIKQTSFPHVYTQMNNTNHEILLSQTCSISYLAPFHPVAFA